MDSEYIEWRKIKELHEKEWKLLKFIRELQYGEVVIKVQV